MAGSNHNKHWNFSAVYQRLTVSAMASCFSRLPWPTACNDIIVVFDDIIVVSVVLRQHALDDNIILIKYVQMSQNCLYMLTVAGLFNKPFIGFWQPRKAGWRHLWTLMTEAKAKRIGCTLKVARHGAEGMRHDRGWCKWRKGLIRGHN